MAYGTKYTTGATLQNQNKDLIQIYVTIKKKDYVGSSKAILSAFDTYKINRNFTNLEEYILGVNFEFQVLDDPCSIPAPDFFDLMDLMTATERQFKIQVDAYVNKIEEVRLFEGFINVESSERKYLPYQPISIVASSYLGKLENYSTVELDTIQTISYIDYISAMLRELGSESNIRINCGLEPTEDWGIQNSTPGNPGYTAFNKTGITTELFFKNNVEKESSLTVLKNILKTFNCYIYWWNDYWYIEHYDNIWESYGDGYKSLVEYDITQSYNPSTGGVWVQEDNFIMDVHDLLFTNMTQTLYAIPGDKKISIKIDNKLYDNLAPSLFSPMIEVSSTTPTLQIRQWARYHEIADTLIDWEDVDLPYRDIENSIKRTCSDIYAWNNFKWKGLMVDTYVTVEEQTTLNLSWRVNFGDSWVQNGSDGVKINQWYTIRFPDLGAEVYLAYNRNDENSGWYLLPTTGYWTDLLLETTQPQFNQDTHSYDFKVSIPLGKINEVVNTYFPVTLPFSGSHRIEVTIGVVTRQLNKSIQTLPETWFGDIDFSVSGNEEPDNLIEGTINTDFLNSREITIMLADQPDRLYINGISRGTNFDERTTTWRSKILGDSDLSLADRLLINKFRFYNVVRERIEGNIYTPLLTWKPFMLFEDSKQANKKFILMGYQHRININAYDLTLLEYDEETEVNLIG